MKGQVKRTGWGFDEDDRSEAIYNASAVDAASD
jgi:hypothetical protein